LFCSTSDFNHPLSIQRIILALMTAIPTLAQLIKQAIETRLLDMHTALIAKVESYDAETQQVDVSPVLKRRAKTLAGEWMNEQLPILCDVPVLFPRAGGFFISFPLQPGDFVQLIFNEADIEEWLEELPPTMTSNERFTLQSAIAIPGIFPRSKTLLGAHKTNLVLGKERGSQIHIDGEKIRLGSESATEALAIASKVKEELDRIKSAFNAHTHISSMGPIKPDDAIITSSDIAAKKVAAE
jgi:hypothetical protein